MHTLMWPPLVELKIWPMQKSSTKRLIMLRRNSTINALNGVQNWPPIWKSCGMKHMMENWRRLLVMPWPFPMDFWRSLTRMMFQGIIRNQSTRVNFIDRELIFAIFWYMEKRFFFYLQKIQFSDFVYFRYSIDENNSKSHQIFEHLTFSMSFKIQHIF